MLFYSSKKIISITAIDGTNNMKFKAKYFILYKNNLNKIIKWPEQWGNTCRANLAPMLQDVLKTRAVGWEMKLIWNQQHELNVIDANKVTREQLGYYLHAQSGSLHFQSQGTRKRAFKALEKMGATGLVLVDNYTDVILYQAHFYKHGEWPNKK